MPARGNALTGQVSSDASMHVDGAFDGLVVADGGLGPERVVEIQRGRIVAAMVEVSAEHGAANVTVAHIVKRAGVSRRTFYEIFDGREECFLGAFDEAIARASRCVLGAYDPEARWNERIRSALTAFLQFLDVEPYMGQLLLVGTLGAGAKALERRQRVLASTIAVVDEGRGQAKSGEGLPALTAEGIVGGVMSVLHTRLLQDDPGVLVGLTGPLMSMIVLPYLGSAAARSELAKPVPRSLYSVDGVARNPLRELEMRLTYRTVRVLIAVAARPGASNRQVADDSGITDQGQISKLLARLQRLELIQRTDSEPARGGPNAWTLTEKGAEVQSAFRANTSAGER